MKIVHIVFPHVITDDGKQIHIDNIAGHPKVGSELVEDHYPSDKIWKIQAVTTDSECVSGVCPIK